MVSVKYIFQERESECCLYALLYIHLYFCTSLGNFVSHWRWKFFAIFQIHWLLQRALSVFNYFYSSDILDILLLHTGIPLVSQHSQMVWIRNLHQTYLLTKDGHWWRHCFSHVTWVQIIEQKQNEEQIPYIRFCCNYIDFKLCQTC